MALDIISTSFIVPGTYIKNTTAQKISAPPSRPTKVVLVGQRLSSGSIAALIPKRVVSDFEPESFWGRGSQLADMFYAYRQINRVTETWGVALDDDGAAVQAEFELTFTGTTTAAGTWHLLIGEKTLNVGVAKGSTPTATAAAVAAAINARTELPVTAVAALGVVTATVRWAGESGNDMKFTVNYLPGQESPAGQTLAIANSVAGATNPDLADALAVLGGEQWNILVVPYADVTNVAALETFLESASDPIIAREGQAHLAYQDVYADMITYGNNRNSMFTTFFPAAKMPTPTWIVASQHAAIDAAEKDPSANLAGRKMPLVLAPKQEDRYDQFEWNALMLAGFSHYTIAPDNTVLVSEPRTMYKKTDQNVVDDKWTPHHKVKTASYIRFFLRYWYTTRWADAKLADDDVALNPAHKIMQPRIGRAEDFMALKVLQSAGMVVNVDKYKDEFEAYRNQQNLQRLDHKIPVQIIDHLKQTAILAEYNFAA